MKDQLVKAFVLDGRVRIYIDRTTDMVQEARDRFDLHPTACAALGRVLSIASIMGSMLKSDQEMLTISISGHGPIGSIIVDAYANGNVRGFVSNPHVEDVYKGPGKLDVGAVVGKDGTMTVTKDLHMAENWTGTIELQSGEIGEDFAYYFTMSEQTPSAVSVGVKIGTDGNVESAGAMLLQMMPDATDEDIRICEHVLSGLKPMSTLMQEYDDSSLDQLVKDMFDDARILETRDIQFHCGCDREKTEKVLMTLPKKDIEELMGQDEGINITCNFCNNEYHFDKDDLQKILDKMNA
ncbi:Hsp33 family molecular chaperone HslO [Faecalibaculum rodentium]|uniref:33 kDa chaperonin n=1 Tax=Faecalibaculum rodentium TaxID=1702221 RepID=A0A1Q9YMW1_9FIRM|nr:Hsp33 family molecular chaperone HslO [Faecalibaculum rodentium]OLU47078.1 molecular chaperone Hsp33 [Faecalibaculum rodentium]